MCSMNALVRRRIYDAHPWANEAEMQLGANDANDDDDMDIKPDINALEKGKKDTTIKDLQDALHGLTHELTLVL